MKTEHLPVIHAFDKLSFNINNNLEYSRRLPQTLGQSTY